MSMAWNTSKGTKTAGTTPPKRCATQGSKKQGNTHEDRRAHRRQVPPASRLAPPPFRVPAQQCLLAHHIDLVPKSGAHPPTARRTSAGMGPWSIPTCFGVTVHATRSSIPKRARGGGFVPPNQRRRCSRGGRGYHAATPSSPHARGSHKEGRQRDHHQGFPQPRLFPGGLVTRVSIPWSLLRPSGVS